MCANMYKSWQPFAVQCLVDALDFVPHSLIHNDSALLLHKGSSHAMCSRNESWAQVLIELYLYNEAVCPLARVYRLLRIKMSESKHEYVSI
jgi:hypothetical protein